MIFDVRDFDVGVSASLSGSYPDWVGCAMRYAWEIQALRDQKKYSEADERRAFVESIGYLVIQNKTQVFVLAEHVIDDIATKIGFDVPSYRGVPSGDHQGGFVFHTEWVPVGCDGGRRIINKAEKPIRDWIVLIYPYSNRVFWREWGNGRSAEGPPSKVTSVQVTNWHDHPNLEGARDMGLPTFPWTADGQMLMASADDGWVLLDMITKPIEAWCRKMAIEWMCDDLRQINLALTSPSSIGINEQKGR